jgi:integrase
MWNWGRLHKEIEGPFPNLGLRYPKIDDKPIFRTRAQIERQLGGECLSSDSELWEAMFLYPAETQEVLELARENSRQPFLQPMCAMAAYTGARRSELLRSRLEDIDLDGGVIAIRERKRIKGTKSIRTVPIANALRKILVPWLDAHPGGPWTFGVTRAKPDRLQLTVNQSNHYLEFALRGTKWSVLHGWHTFRHTFVSACACKGIDQRIIDTWVGHQTDAMRRRYRHLFPDVESKAMEQVFAETGN